MSLTTAKPNQAKFTLRIQRAAKLHPRRFYAPAAFVLIKGRDRKGLVRWLLKIER